MENDKLKERNQLWETISNSEFIFESQCYKTCSSFCCRWGNNGVPLKIIPKGGTLFYLPQEYNYLQKYGKITDKPLYKMSISTNNINLEILYKHCTDDNNCNILFSRSLYCKLYPFLPVFNIDGKVVDVKYISVYDVTYEFIEQKTPCYVKDLKNKYLEFWKNDEYNITLLKEPYIMFHLMVANIIHDNYLETLKNSPLKDLTGNDFWKKWEKFYLAGRLINKEKLKNDIENLYTEFAKRYNISEVFDEYQPEY